MTYLWYTTFTLEVYFLSFYVPMIQHSLRCLPSPPTNWEARRRRERLCPSALYLPPPPPYGLPLRDGLRGRHGTENAQSSIKVPFKSSYSLTFCTVHCKLPFRHEHPLKTSRAPNDRDIAFMKGTTESFCGHTVFIFLKMSFNLLLVRLPWYI